jgi:hypothetical protein
MAKVHGSRSDRLDELRADNERLRQTVEQLRAENVRLQQAADDQKRLTAATVPPGGSSAPQARRHPWRALAAALFAAFAVALLVAGNLLFWAGNTVVKNDRFAAAVTPVIRDKTVQQALAGYTTAQLYANVDVTRVIQNALPPRADFVAPALASQLRGQTESALRGVLARPQFQDRWNQLLTQSHAKFITTVQKSGGDGVIDLNELYQQLSASLANTKLSFLAGKQLPAKVGNVQVVSGAGIRALHDVSVHIDAWRWLALLLLAVCVALAIWLAQRRRRMVQLLTVYGIAALIAMLVAVRLVREIIADRVAAPYADAVRHTAQYIFHPLVVQSTTIGAMLLVVVLAAWLTGSSRSARVVQGRLQLLVAGKLHQTLFGAHESAFTRGVGRYKRVLEWTVVAAAVLLLLITRLTLAALLVYTIVTLVLVMIIELVGAPARQGTARKNGHPAA